MSEAARSSAQVQVHVDDLPAARDAKRLGDDSTLLLLLAIAMVVAVPWFLRDLDINLAPVTWSIFIYASASLLVSRLADSLTSGAALRWVIAAMQAANVIFAAWIWHLAGNLQHPLFLLILVLPVTIVGWTLKPAQAMMLTLVAVAAVGSVALVNSPELRWYLAQMGMPVVLLPEGIGYGASRPFPSVELPASYQFLLLVTFALAMATVTLAVQSAAALLVRAQSRLRASQHALEDAQTLAVELLQVSPHPAALVYTDNFNIAYASASFLEEMLLLPESLQEKNLFSLVAFSYPEIIEKLIASDGGEVPFVVYHVNAETRMAKIVVRPIEHGGVRYAAVFIHAATDQFYHDAALDAVAQAIIVIGDDRCIRYCNLATRTMFPNLHPGMGAATSLRQTDAAEDWWELGQRLRRERPVVLAGRNFQATCVGVRIPGEEARATVVLLQENGR